MTISPVHLRTIDLLLSAITLGVGEQGLQSSFLFGKPGSAHWQQQIGAEIFYQRREFVRAILYVRKNGPNYVRHLSLDDIWSMLQEFIRENYWYIAQDVFGTSFDDCFANHVSKHSKEQLAAALAGSRIFAPKETVSLFPLSTIRSNSDFSCNVFFLIAPNSLTAENLPSGLRTPQLVPTRFPPFPDWQGKVESPISWLGIRSPTVHSAEKLKAAVLGAIALAPLPKHRHMFSGRPVASGRMILEATKASTSYGEPHTPPSMYDIIVENNDHPWLSILAEKLSSSDRSAKRQVRALEYFYRAWSLAESERFSVLYMTLDSLFGDSDNATQSIVTGVQGVIGDHIPYERLRLLARLRASVVHGGAPDVYDSSKYGKYYNDYDADPIFDLELIASECLRRYIFSGKFREQNDPNENIIAELRAKGRLPPNLSRNTILG